jgi:hypothetical protein
LLLALCSKFKLPETAIEIVALAAAVGFLASPIFAAAALIAIHRNRGLLIGRGMAIFSICWWLVVACWGFSNRSSSVMVHPRRLRCDFVLKQIDIALEAYHADNDDRYPPSLGCLVPRWLSDFSLFQFRRGEAPRMEDKFDERLCSFHYVYYPDDSVRRSDLDLERAVIVFAKNINLQADDMNAVFMNGRVQFVQRERLIGMLSAMASNEKLSQPTRDSIRKTLAEVLAEGPVKR